MKFEIGDKVTLTDAMKNAAVEPEKYQEGTVTNIGSWRIVEVMWNGFDHPISVREDEIRRSKNERMD